MTGLGFLRKSEIVVVTGCGLLWRRQYNMRLIAQHIKVGSDRMTLDWEGGSSWNVRKRCCPKEARAVTSHLIGLDPSDASFMSKANAELAKIGFTIRLSK